MSETVQKGCQAKSVEAPQLAKGVNFIITGTVSVCMALARESQHERHPVDCSKVEARI